MLLTSVSVFLIEKCGYLGNNNILWITVLVRLSYVVCQVFEIIVDPSKHSVLAAIIITVSSSYSGDSNLC